ncbi:MAG: hypothetical protein GY926_04875, partial [bacterium]|nr:hypothetical protein [bacterium]
TPSPFVLGEFWLDPATMFAVGSGVMQGTGNTGHIDLPVPIAAKAFPLGTTFAFQAIVLDGQTAELSVAVRASVVPRFPPK